MLLKVDTSDAVPVYAQIVDQVKRAIASGVLAPGDALPSLRETAMKLRINPLTVGRAYRDLEAAGLIETRHGLGSFITEGARGPADGFGRETIARSMDSLLVDALHLGISFDEVRQLLEERMKAAPALPGASGDEEVER